MADTYAYLIHESDWDSDAYLGGETEASDDRAFGVLELTLRTNSYAWRFVDRAQQVRDSGSGNCR